MKINRFLFPIVVLAIFVLVVGGAMILGFWQTKGGQHRGDGGRHESALPSAGETIVLVPSIPLFGEVIA